MTLADDLKTLVEPIRAIPGELGLRPYRVFVVTTFWDGPRTGEGTAHTQETELLENGQPPKVRSLSEREITQGALEAGTIRVGPITPPHPSGGTSIDVLSPELMRNEQREIKLIGPDTAPNGDLYRLVGVNAERSIHYTIDILDPHESL